LEKKIKLLGLIGSIRKGSFNKTLMQAAVELMPENAEIEVFDIAAIPLFNQAFEDTPAPVVKDLKAKIKAADALLIATPEYNYSIPGVLKNAIDSASRPYGDNAFDGKPVALMSASIGRLGGARAQYHLRQSFVFLNMFPINYPEVMLPQAQQNVDENGKLTNEEIRKLIRQLLEELVKWTKKLGQKP
jgi:chromate reductase, NAD(P)H dehydrogenase (quinone)